MDKRERWRAAVAGGEDPRRAAGELGVTKRTLLRWLRELEAEREATPTISDADLRRQALRGILIDPKASAESKLAAGKALRQLELAQQPRPEPAPGAPLGFALMAAALAQAPVPLPASPPVAAAPAPVPAAATPVPAPEPEQLHGGLERVDRELAAEIARHLPDPPAAAPVDAPTERAHEPRTSTCETFEDFRARHGRRHSADLVRIARECGYQPRQTEREALLREIWEHAYNAPDDRKPLPQPRPKRTDPALVQAASDRRFTNEFMNSDADTLRSRGWHVSTASDPRGSSGGRGGWRGMF